MALFSRGKRDRDRPRDEDADRPAEPVTPTPTAEPAVTDATADDRAPHSTDETTDAAPEASVGISVSAFRGVGAAPQPASRPAAPEVAPPARESMPGVRDNALLAQALAGLGDPPTPQQFIEVARQLLQGHLFLRVKGDARSLLSEGKPLPLGIVTLGDETFVVAYSGGAALRASLETDGDSDTSAMGQTSLVVIRHVLGGEYAGLVIDPASAPARAVVRRDMLERMLEGIDPQLELKTLLASDRTMSTPASVVAALGRGPFWVAVSRVGDTGRMGVAEARMSDGGRYLELFSHPLEVVALGRGDQPAPMTADQLGKALRADTGITGAIVDPAGPWIRLSRADLGAIISG